MLQLQQNSTQHSQFGKCIKIQHKKQDCYYKTFTSVLLILIFYTIFYTDFTVLMHA